MLADVKHINPMPRKDGGPKPFLQHNSDCRLEYDPASESYTINLFDKGNPEFRVTVTFGTGDLKEARKATGRE